MHDQMLFFCCFVKSRLWRPIINALRLPTNGNTFGEHFACRNFKCLSCFSPLKMIAMGLLLFFRVRQNHLKTELSSVRLLHMFL